MHVLDGFGAPVPAGVPGELYIGGAGVARGYWRHPELTAERFLPDPFGRNAGARLYRTGDIGRYLPDGNIEYLGRLDDQVKVRGFRIELGEIESVIGAHPSVSQVLVLVREVSGEKRLVAYVVLREGARFGVSELREVARTRLPEYMVPSELVCLESFPLTANGKVDRRALPVPDGTRPDLESGFVAPRTAVEELLAGIWSEVLGVDRVGIHDNFFELGGNSLAAIRLAARVREKVGHGVELRTMLDRPTVAGLAEALGPDVATRVARGEPVSGDNVEMRIPRARSRDPHVLARNLESLASRRKAAKRHPQQKGSR
jgi:hypothetical protein